VITIATSITSIIEHFVSSGPSHDTPKRRIVLEEEERLDVISGSVKPSAKRKGASRTATPIS
jgi:hypothetical protein